MAEQRLEHLRLALMMLTRLPVGRLADPAPTLAQAAWAFPVPGLIVGLIGWLGFSGSLAFGLPAPVAAIVTLTLIALVTGALHHDGLADFADGIGGGRDRAHCLEIMRDSRIGSYGVVALILAVALQGSAMATLAGTAGLAAFLFLGVASRFMMLALLVLLPPARADGLGSSATSRDPKALLPGALLLLVLAFFVGGSIATLIGMSAVAYSIAALARRRIGGQTGDVLGAAQLISETAGWVVLSAYLL